MNDLQRATARSISHERCLSDFEPSSFIGEGCLRDLSVVAGVVSGRFMSVEVEARTVVYELEAWPADAWRVPTA
jgi:hypothetical protein